MLMMCSVGGSLPSGGVAPRYSPHAPLVARPFPGHLLAECEHPHGGLRGSHTEPPMPHVPTTGDPLLPGHERPDPSQS